MVKIRRVLGIGTMFLIIGSFVLGKPSESLGQEEWECGSCYNVNYLGIPCHTVDEQYGPSLPWFNNAHEEPLMGGCGSEYMMEHHDFCADEEEQK